tara:strand:+ start:8368 stop:9945 length:1578 start_codon:yes stop_codon:yes gene_type:complete
MSYYNAIKAGKKDAINRSLGWAQESLKQDILTDSEYRALLMEHINALQKEITLYDKAIAELGVVNADDPAEIRRKFVRTTSSKAGDSQLDALRVYSDLATAKAEQMSKNKSAEAAIFAPARSVHTPSMTRLADDLRAANATIAGAAGDDVRLAAIAPQVQRVLEGIQLELGPQGAEEKYNSSMRRLLDAVELGVGADLAKKLLVDSQGIANSLADTANAMVAGGAWHTTGQFEDYKRDQSLDHGIGDYRDIDSAMDLIVGADPVPGRGEGGLLKELPAQGTAAGTTRTETETLTAEAKAIKKKRASTEYKALQQALFDDGEITPDEEAAWRKVRDPSDTRTLGDLRLEFLDDYQLDQLERRAGLKSQRAATSDRLAQARSDLASMKKAPKFTAEEVQKRAAGAYQGMAESKVPLGLNSILAQMNEDEVRAMQATHAARSGNVSTREEHRRTAEQLEKHTPRELWWSKLAEMSGSFSDDPDEQNEYRKGVGSILAQAIINKVNLRKDRYASQTEAPAEDTPEQPGG